MTLRRARTALFVAGLLFSLSWPAARSENSPARETIGPVVSVIELESNPSPIENSKVEWRRTVNGWEPTSVWSESGLSLPPAALHLHPAVVAMLQALISIGALLTFEFTDEDEADDLIHMLKR